MVTTFGMNVRRLLLLREVDIKHPDELSSLMTNTN